MIFNLFSKSVDKLKSALSKTSQKLSNTLRSLFHGPLDEEKLEKLEEALFEADLGPELAESLTQEIRQVALKKPKMSFDELIACLREKILALFKMESKEEPLSSPHVILVIGVNGNGKTTTLAKLANLYKSQGKKVLIGAADTFRAAAMDQLEIWAEKIGVDIVKGTTGADPSSVAFDAMNAALSRKADIVLIDTAGRLHTKTDLMQELAKIKRTLSKVHPSAPHETLLVLDATTGQNGIDQASVFHQHTPLSGLVLTKLDGTAKGGIALAIHQKIRVPIRYIGTGEKIDDIAIFDPKSFVESLLA